MKLIWWLIGSHSQIIDIFSQLFEEWLGELIREFIDIVKESCDHIILDFDQRDFIVCVLYSLVADNLMKYLSNDFLLFSLIIQSLSWNDFAYTI